MCEEGNDIYKILGDTKLWLRELMSFNFKKMYLIGKIRHQIFYDSMEKY